MSKINLIPEIKQKKQKIQKVNATVTSIATFVAIILGGITLLLLSYNGLLAGQISSTNKKISTTENNIKTMKDLEDQVSNLEYGLKNIKQITESNKSWTKFFSDIEKATPADVQFVSFYVNGNQISANLRGSDIRSIDRFIASFETYLNSDKKNVFSNVLVSGYSKKDSGEYVFDAKFDVNEEAAW